MALTRTRAPKRPAAPPAAAAPVGYAGDFLPVEALGADGLVIRSDGALVRYLEVTPGNPLVLDEEGVQRLTRGFTDMLLRVPGGMSVQLYAQATYVSLEKLLGGMRAETDGATAHLAASPERALRAQAAALRRLAATHEEALALHAEDQAAVEVRFILVVPLMPGRPTHQTGTIRLPANTRRTASASSATPSSATCTNTSCSPANRGHSSTSCAPRCAQWTCRPRTSTARRSPTCSSRASHRPSRGPCRARRHRARHRRSSARWMSRPSARRPSSAPRGCARPSARAPWI